MSISKTILIGRLGQDPELKYAPSGNAVCNFTVATSESYTDKQGVKKEVTEWHRIVVWGKLAEPCNQYLSKGREVYIEGQNKTRTYDDKDGVKRYTTEVVAEVVQFLGSKKSSEDKQKELAGESANLSVDDIPF